MKSSKIWLPQEDAALMRVYRQRNTQKWARISSILQSEYGILKSPKKCRQRFKNHLNPSINKQDWSETEETTLINLQKQLGNRWAQISRRLPGRTDNAVKNKFYSMFRKAVVKINSLLSRQPQSQYKEIQIPFIYKLISLVDNKHKTLSSSSEEVAKESQALKYKILQYKDVQSESYVLQEGQLEHLFNKIQLINSFFKKNMMRRVRRKVGCTKHQKMEVQQTNLKMTTEDNLQELEKHSKNELSQEVKFLPHKFQNPLFFISSTRDKMIIQSQHNNNELCIQKLYDEESDIWQISNQNNHFSSEEHY